MRDQLLRRAERAARLLEDETLREAFAEVEADAIAAWKGETDPIARDEIWQRLKAAEAVRAKLQGFADAGTMAKKRIRVFG